MRVVSIIVILASVSISASIELSSLSSSSCVPLPQCKILNWMWRHRSEIPQANADTVASFIQSLKCGLDICPKETKIKGVDRNPLIHGLRRNPVKKNAYHDLVDYGCKAYLKLHMFKKKLDANSFYYQEVHSRSATMTDRNMNVYKIENLGNCCWEIYSGTHFSGEKEKLRRHFDGAPKMKRVRTARVVDC